MGRLTKKEVSILVTFVCSMLVMALAVWELVRGGSMVLEYVQTSLILAVLARVM